MKSKIILNSKIKLCIKSIIIFFTSFLFWLLLNLIIYPEKIYNMTDYINEANLHDFSLENGMITSTSQDPWITLTFSDKQFVKTIEIEITEISEIDVTATILTGGGQIWKSKSLNLQTGINLVCFPWLWDDLSFLRLDLAEKPNVSLKIGYIIINNPLQIAKSALVESFFLGLLLVFVFNIVILKKKRTFK